MAKVKDPVCGMQLDSASAKFKAKKGGKSYYFCSAECRGQFLAGK
jgi:Cu+-exporting ATPase